MWVMTTFDADSYLFDALRAGASGFLLKNAEAEQLKARAAKICDQLPALLATQQQLAAAVPAFKPYATMDQGSIDKCRDGQVELP